MKWKKWIQVLQKRMIYKNNPQRTKIHSIDPTPQNASRLRFAADVLGRPISTGRIRILILLFIWTLNFFSATWRWSAVVCTMFRRSIPAREMEAPRWTAAEIGRDSKNKRRAIRAMESRALIAAINFLWVLFERGKRIEETSNCMHLYRNAWEDQRRVSNFRRNWPWIPVAIAGFWILCLLLYFFPF